MKNKAALVAAVTVLSLVAGIGIAKLTGYWRTESGKVPIKISGGEFAGEPDPGDIRGSYSFGDIEAAFGVPPEMTAAAFGVTASDPASVLTKDLKIIWGELGGDVEVGTDAVKLFTALWTGLPFDAEDTTALPAAAVDILETYGYIDTVKAADLRRTAVALPIEVGGEAPPAEGSSDHEITDGAVRGNTTFGDLKNWGVSDELWVEKFGTVPGSRLTVLKEWADENGWSVSEVKAIAQEMVDSGE